MQIATWNVNSIRAREKHVLRWLESAAPDLLFMQEIKCEAQDFPTEGFARLGYQLAIVGQKSYNGVAVAARIPFTVTHRCLPGQPDGEAQARYIEVAAGGFAIGGLYLPNGNSGGDEGYQYKLDWMDRLNARAASLLAEDTPSVLLGDYNVCPHDIDFAPGTIGEADALIRPATRQRFRALEWMGYTDALRAMQPDGQAYTFWDYQAGAWPRDRGLRIDHAMLSPTVAEMLTGVTLYRDERGQVQASDHIPVMVALRDR